MQIRLSKRIVSLGLVAIVAVIVIAVFGKRTDDSATIVDNSAVDGTITVKAGYFPREVVLPADRKTVLRFITNNTYDCSASLLIAKLRIEKFLPPTGNTDIVLPAQPAGTELMAGCSMGMYSFKIKFQ